MHIVEEFKGEALRGIFSHAKKLFVPVIGLLVLVGVAMLALVLRQSSVRNFSKPYEAEWKAAPVLNRCKN
jgi:hypothetical protein